MSVKFLKFTFLNLICKFYTKVWPGYKYYRNIKKEFGSDASILICPHKGTGDIYFIGLYLKEFLNINKIDNYVFLFRGKAEQKIGELFGIKKFKIINDKETQDLMNFKFFLGESNLDIYDLHHYPWTRQIQDTGLLEGFNNITFDKMFRFPGMGVGNEAKRVLPVFKNNENKFKKIFKEKKLIPGKTFIIAPYASSMPKLPVTFWEKLVKELKKMGYTVATNSSGVKEPVIVGTESVFFEYNESVPFVEYAGGFIGLRSGLCDIISSARCKKIILYSYYDPEVKWINWSGKTKKYFGLKNNALCENAIEIEFDLYNLNELGNTILKTIKYPNETASDICLVKNLSPVFSDNKIAISLVFNEWFVPYASVTIQSILDHATNNNTYDIVLLHDGISTLSRERMQKLISGYKNVSIRFFDIREIFGRYSFYTEKGYRPIIYARFILPELLKSYEKIIYLDSDLILNCDISQLYDIDLGNNLLGGVRDLVMIAWYHTPGNIERKYITEKIKLKDPDNYINSGVLVFNVSEFNKHFDTQFLLEYASSRNWQWMDQDVFMTLCEGKIKILPQSWNTLSSMRNDVEIILQSDYPDNASLYLHALEKPKIIHFIGCGFLQLHNQPQWSELYWKHAKKTLFYEVLHYRATEITLELCGRLNMHHSKKDVIWNKVTYYSSFILPYGSERREFVKKIYKKYGTMTDR